MNTLYFGDNLEILKRHVADASVDLCYLDPPFNSNRDYNVLFREQSGSESPAQIKAFGDTWNWAGAAQAWAEFPALCPVPKVIELMHGFHNAIGENDVMAYLVMMAPRLYHLHRVLKPTGSLYLHCDPTASHYLKLILDGIFGVKNFKNEIIWKRTSAHSSARRWGDVHDTVLFYTKSISYVWNVIHQAYDEAYVGEKYRNEDERGKYSLSDLTAAGVRTGDSGQSWRNFNPTSLGRHWAVPREIVAALVNGNAASLTTQEKLDLLDAQGYTYWPERGRREGGGFPRYKRYLKGGMPIQDNITDIFPINSQAAERLGYPTQKPLALLERIISASSNPGDIVLDSFCGCGTAVIAAQKLGREWIGIDVTPIATSLVQKRLFDTFGAKNARLLSKDDPAKERAFAVEGLPTDLAGAKLLYDKEPTHKDFEMWAVGLVPAIPQEKKGADRGIDGLAYFHDNPKKPSKAVVQVKGGHVTANQIRDLIGTMTTEKAQLGFFVSLEAPTQPMRSAALAAGYYQPPSGFGRRVEALQIRTIDDLLQGRGFDFPLYGSSNVSYAQAERMQADVQQASMEL